MEQDRKPRDKSMHIWSWILIKEARIYNGEMTDFSTTVGKTVYSHAKE